MEKLRRHHISFQKAIDGIIWAFTTQPNFKIHLFLALLSLILGVLFQITQLEMLIIILCIVFGLGAEMINTAIESMTDLITTEWRQKARIAKDVSAGMMLLIAIGTALIGLAIFLPRIISFMLINF